MRYLILAMLFVLAAGLAGADEEKDKIKVPPVAVVQLDRKDPVVYEKDIQPIFEAKCFFCHSGNVVKGKLDMSTHEKLMKGGKSGNTAATNSEGTAKPKAKATTTTPKPKTSQSNSDSQQASQAR